MLPRQPRRERALSAMRDEHDTPDPFQCGASDHVAKKVGGDPVWCVGLGGERGEGCVGEEAEEEGCVEGSGGEDEVCDYWCFGL